MKKKKKYSLERHIRAQLSVLYVARLKYEHYCLTGKGMMLVMINEWSDSFVSERSLKQCLVFYLRSKAEADNREITI